jgi:CubicO group peptidase (beta-lactamase class C family)
MKERAMRMRMITASLMFLLTGGVVLAQTGARPARPVPAAVPVVGLSQRAQLELGEDDDENEDRATRARNPIRSGAARSGPARSGAAGPSASTNLATETYKDELDRAIQEHFDEKKLPGLTVLYARDGLLTYKKSLGFADVGGGVAMNENKIGRLNSVSKWVGTILAMKMQEQGEINLNAKVRDCLPDIPEHHTYRIIDALACRSGVRHYGGAKSNKSPTNDWGEKDYSEAADAIPNFWHDPLAVPVGAYHYSSFGYPIADACLEEASGKSLRQLLKDKISTPNGLSSLKVEDLEDNDPNRVKFYTVKNGQNSEIAPPKKEWTPSGGGMQATPKHLLQLGILLGDGKIISKQNVKKMMTRIELSDSYCLGCNTAVENGNHVMAKSGSAEGSNAYIWLVPDRRMVMVVMANRDGAGVSELGKELRDIVLSTDKAGGQKPDLVVEDFARTGGPTYKDGKWEIAVRFKVVNDGGAGADQAFVNTVMVGDDHRWSGFTDGLPPKGSKTINATVKVSDPGKVMAGRTIDLFAYADAPLAAADTSIPAYGRIKESNDNNNKVKLEVKLPGGLGIGLAAEQREPSASGAGGVGGGSGKKPPQRINPANPERTPFRTEKPESADSESDDDKPRVPQRIGKAKRLP